MKQYRLRVGVVVALTAILIVAFAYVVRMIPANQVTTLVMGRWIAAMSSDAPADLDLFCGAELQRETRRQRPPSDGSRWHSTATIKNISIAPNMRHAYVELDITETNTAPVSRVDVTSIGLEMKKDGSGWKVCAEDFGSGPPRLLGWLFRSIVE